MSNHKFIGVFPSGYKHFTGKEYKDLERKFVPIYGAKNQWQAEKAMYSSFGQNWMRVYPVQSFDIETDFYDRKEAE